jgi:uridine kinase
VTYELRQVFEDPAAAIDRCENAYGTQVEQAARMVLENREKSPVVLLAGPSGSSKTTTAERLVDALARQGVRGHLISMDNYYLSRSDPAFPRQPDGKPDLESPLGLDIPLLNEHFALLETGQDIYVPIYDFPSHSRLEGRSLRMDPSQGDVFVFEGIHALNPRFTDQHPDALRIFVSPEDDFSLDGEKVCGPILLRLMRRLSRDYLFRGASVQYSLELWGNVLESEKQYVSPYKASAHCCITTTLAYELCVLKGYVAPLLGSVPADAPCGDQVMAMGELLPKIQDISPELVPQSSILREFIGGAHT